MAEVKGQRACCHYMAMCIAVILGIDMGNVSDF